MGYRTKKYKKYKKGYKKYKKAKRSAKKYLRRAGRSAPFGGLVELKYKDTAYNGLVGSAAAAANHVHLTAGLAQGDDNTNRTGRKVTVKSIWMKMALRNTTETDAAPVRLILVHDQTPNNGTPATLDAVVDSTATQMTTGFPKIDNQRRFKVLWEHHVQVGDVTGTGEYRYIEKFLPCKIDVSYSGTTGSSGELVNGAIMLFAVKEDNSLWVTPPGSQQVELNANTRIRFLDL